ncbi:DUF2914 domain-containing protein [Pendulispora brunnea]|uniref:DUF2914 domain-containing protein n=1 Tax=Pendulispora brunnea TaxID=2905690 RepID=A0ABZ2JXH0_9BACT
MKLSHVVLVAAAALVPSLIPAAAHADGGVSIVSSQFTDRVEGGKPVGDAKSVAGARKVVYWIDAANTGDPAQITLVWTVDGKEVQRQSLDVGHAPHWRTWGSRPVGGAKSISVRILDAAGTSLKEDSVSLEAKPS